MNPYKENASEPSAQSPEQETLPPWGETSVVGRPIARVDAYERVSGSALYTLDRSFPDMLHAAVVRCPHAHARVRRVDTARAESMPGVHAVITGSTPGADIPWHPDDASHPTSRLFDSICRHEGEEVAAVAAETPHQAWDAMRAIEVDYELLPFVTDMEKALEPGAAAVHGSGNLVREPGVRERGDVSAGFAEADVVLEETYRTSYEIHTPMEVHASIARWDGDRLTVWDSTQGVFDQQSALAKTLGLPMSSVRVICPYMGGGFGSKLDLGKYTVIAALLAKKTARPVKLALPREDTFLCVGNRPANRIEMKAGVKKDGTLTALQAVLVGGVGAYPGYGSSAYLIADLYRCPHIRVESKDVYINAGIQRAFRAPGFPQCAWALEQMMDALAEKIGMDPVELRLKNLTTSSQARSDLPYTSTGLEKCLTEGAKVFGWGESRGRSPGKDHLRRGVGMAAGMWGYAGEPRSTVIVKLFADGSVNLNMGASDIGTGTKTVMSMVVAEELGVPVERIQIEHADTASTQYAPASGGSQTVVANAPAVRSAAVEVKRQLLEIAAVELGVPADDLRLTEGRVQSTTDPTKGRALSELEGLGERVVLVGVGRRGPLPSDKVPLPFVAQFAEVEVNMRTGEVRVLRFVAAHDSGRVMNRLTYENQVFGGITMGIGFGLTERRVLDRQTGKMVNANWHDYKIPTMKDVPVDQTCVPIDPHDTECNTTGAKGLGEPATIPTAAAIANAVHHATGVRVTEAPMSPITILRFLDENRRTR